MEEENIIEEEIEEELPIPGIGTMVFGKWDASEVVCSCLLYTSPSPRD